MDEAEEVTLEDEEEDSDDFDEETDDSLDALEEEAFPVSCAKAEAEESSKPAASVEARSFCIGKIGKK